MAARLPPAAVHEQTRRLIAARLVTLATRSRSSEPRPPCAGRSSSVRTLCLVGVRPPSGTVTFLFTDIEGSTRRWEADPEAMRAALVLHDEVLRSAIEAHGGWLFKHTGDGVCAAFGSARAAIDAAVAGAADVGVAGAHGDRHR